MKRIGFITTNKAFAQSLAASIKNCPDLGFETFLLLNLDQAALDAEIMKIDIAIVDVIAGASRETSKIMRICEDLRQGLTQCRILMLVPPEYSEGRDTTMIAVKNKIVDDYLFYDASLDYMLTKLLYL